MQRLIIAASLTVMVSVHYVLAFGNRLAYDNRHTNYASMVRRTVLCPQLSALQPPSSTPPSLDSNSRSKPKKKNKYANFSKVDSSMDPLDAMISESRSKLREMHRDEPKTSRKRRKSSSSEITSLEAVDQLLTSVDGKTEEVLEVVEEKRERNKRVFVSDTKSIDPSDPTTFGFIELGTIIGAHGVHGMMKLTSITDFSQHRLCQPGTRHIKPPNRRSPREVQLVEGRPVRSDAETIGTDTKPMYLIRLENVDDRDEAMKQRGSVLYALQEEKVDELLEDDEYIVSDLVGLNVFLDENEAEHSGKGFDDLFVGNIRGVVMGSEMCAIPGLGQDLLEVALPSMKGGESEDLVLVPFVPEIVSRVSLNGRMISIIPPAGLLDLSYRREEKVRIKGLLPPAREH